MKDAVRMATVHSSFRMAPWSCCARLVVEGENNRLLTNTSHVFQLRKWRLDKDDPTTKPVRKLQLLYRMTQDGASAKVFHELCDDKGPTVTLIQGLGGDGMHRQGHNYIFAATRIYLGHLPKERANVQIPSIGLAPSSQPSPLPSQQPSLVPSGAPLMGPSTTTSGLPSLNRTSVPSIRFYL